MGFLGTNIRGRGRFEPLGDRTMFEGGGGTEKPSLDPTLK
jgi:hypothetical protein